MVILPTHNNSTCFMLFQHHLNGLWRGFATQLATLQAYEIQGRYFYQNLWGILRYPAKKTFQRMVKGNSSLLGSWGFVLSIKAWNTELQFTFRRPKMEPANASLVPSQRTEPQRIGVCSWQSKMPHIMWCIYVCLWMHICVLICMCIYIYL